MVSPCGDPVRHGSTMCLFPGVPGAGNGYRAPQVRCDTYKNYTVHQTQKKTRF